MKRYHFFIISVLSLMLMTTSFTVAQPRHQGQQRIVNQLTQQQRETLRETVQELRAQGATQDEIRKAVADLFKSWNLEMPEHRKHRHDNALFADLLTEEQQETLKSTIKQLREQGASRKEIHEAVADLFESWDLEMPERPSQPARFQQLTDEQKKELREYIRSLHQSGQTRQEIREAVQEWLNKNTAEQASNITGTIQSFNAPNPFNPNTTINYELTDPGHVTVKIFNTAGQLIRSFDMGYQNTGTHSISWNGRNSSGASVPSGTYIYQLQSGDQITSERMLLLK